MYVSVTISRMRKIDQAELFNTKLENIKCRFEHLVTTYKGSWFYVLTNFKFKVSA